MRAEGVDEGYGKRIFGPRSVQGQVSEPFVGFVMGQSDFCVFRRSAETATVPNRRLDAPGRNAELGQGMTRWREKTSHLGRTSDLAIGF